LTGENVGSDELDGWSGILLVRPKQAYPGNPPPQRAQAVRNRSCSVDGSQKSWTLLRMRAASSSLVLVLRPRWF